MRVYHDFYLVPGSTSTFSEVDPDPAQWYGSNRIRIRNTGRRWIENRKGRKKEEIYLWICVLDIPEPDSAPLTTRGNQNL